MKFIGVSIWNELGGTMAPSILSSRADCAAAGGLGASDAGAAGARDVMEPSAAGPACALASVKGQRGSLTHAEERTVAMSHAEAIDQTGAVAQYAGEARGPIGGALKRAFDVVAASAAIVFLAMAFAVIYLLVRLDSPGPGFFRQERVGFGGRKFMIWKFRTMYCGGDAGGKIRQCTRGDPRVTRIGAFLRSTSLDELPQLFNVVSGDMALVGPRPHAAQHDIEFARIDPTYASRQVARPGITGLAQVMGCRGETQTDEAVRARTAFDLKYVRSWTFFADVAILLRTVMIVFRDPAAY